nr:hypothetical protein [Candidatus Sigynarchaeota archaeon]
MQFNFEIFADVLAGFTFLVAACVCIVQGQRKKNSALRLFAIASIAFGTSIFFQAFSYMILLESYGVAMLLKQMATVLSVFGYIFIFVFVNYVWFERMRLWLLIPPIILATLEIASIFFTEGLVPYYFFENETLIATSIGKAGFLLLFEMILANVLLELVIIAYFTKSYMKAPESLKKTALILLLYSLLSVFASVLISLITRFSPNGAVNLFLYGLNYLMITSVYMLIIALAIRNPQLLCILPFRVDRLLIIYNNSGLPIFDYQFSTQKVDGILFSGLIQGLQSLSVEVLQKGQISQVILESGVLTFRKMKMFTVGLLASRSSQILGRSFIGFTNAFDKQYTTALQQFKGDRSMFDSADRLVHEYFGYVPTNA